MSTLDRRVGAGTTVGREVRMDVFFYWMWAGIILFIVLFFSPFFGEVAARVPRLLGRSPRIWDDSARVLTADVDGEGLLQALVYDGEEQIFDPRGTNLRHWVRRWERDRGIVWERRAELSRPDVVVAVGDKVVLPTREGTLRAIDARTGQTRWDAKLDLEQLEPTVAVGSMVLIGGMNRRNGSKAWLQIDTRDGSIAAEGRGDRDAAEQRLRGEPQGAEPALDDIEGWRRYLGDDMRLRRLLFEDASQRQQWLVDNRIEVRREARPAGESYHYELVVRSRDGAGDFRYPIGLASANSALRSVRPIGSCYVVLVSEVYRGREGKQSVTLVIEPARRRVLADIGQSGSRVLAPGGKLVRVAL